MDVHRVAITLVELAIENTARTEYRHESALRAALARSPGPTPFSPREAYISLVASGSRSAPQPAKPAPAHARPGPPHSQARPGPMLTMW